MVLLGLIFVPDSCKVVVRPFPIAFSLFHLPGYISRYSDIGPPTEPDMSSLSLLTRARARIRRQTRRSGAHARDVTSRAPLGN